MKNWQYKPARDLGEKPSEQFRDLRREGGLLSAIARFGWWSLARTYLAVGHRLTISGRERIPKHAPFIMVANHSSHLDTLSLASALRLRLRDVAFPIAAGDYFFATNRVAAFAAIFMNALPMWRKSCGRHAMEQLRERLSGDACVFILFPEGTRSRDGSMSSFKPGLGMLVAGSETPVVPCYLEGAHHAYPADRKFPRFTKVRLRIGKPLVFEDAPNDRAGWKAIADRAQEAVEGLAGEA